MTKKIYRINDFVFVNSDRGRTPGIARITKITVHGEAEIIFDNGEKDKYYFAHLFQTADCIKRRIAFIKERAEKVGKVTKNAKKVRK